MQDTQVTIDDHYRNIRDSVGLGKRPKGRVSIYEIQENGNRVKIEETNNLVVYQGRTWLIQRAFNQDLSAETTTDKGSYINWFGLGVGGAGSNLLIPITPKLADRDLYEPISINNVAAQGTINSGKLHGFDSIEYKRDTEYDNEYLIASITTTIGSNDANGPDGTTCFDLNEAGLYVSNSNDPLDYVGGSAASHLSTIKLFARVTFSSIRKTSDRQIVFVWNIYF